MKVGVRIENLEQDGHNQDGALEASYHKLVILVLFLNPEGQQDLLTVYRDLQFIKLSGLINGKTSVISRYHLAIY